MTTTEPKARWRPSPGELKTLRGMIIDRNDAWRADAEMAPVIDAAIRRGILSDRETFWKIYHFLRHSNLPGSYKTAKLDEQQMRKAWRRYRRKHYPEPVDIATANHLRPRRVHCRYSFRGKRGGGDGGVK